ncbi:MULTISPECIES: response regulator transcription factor [Pedobacter]|uniref:response regulator transcription factor n=1 Tax=Pedobacter TaxID=84567 RepID=UPI00210CD19F|nr:MULTISPECIES: response regulator [unclassified Pedobacter]
MGKIIHVVEDDDDIRFIIEYILMDSGYQVFSSATATAFYETMNNPKPDLVLLDVMLPDGNGIDICRDIRLSKDADQIKVIVMSAHAAEKAVLEQACADSFISKPFDLDKLITQVKKLLPND